MPDKLVQNEFSELVTKILFPAFLTVAVGVAIEMKNNKNNVSILSVFLSLVIGLGVAYLFSGVLLENFKGGSLILCAGFITSVGEKLAKFVLYKFNVDIFLMVVADYAYQKLKNLLK
jgi:hypothetical protein